MVLQGSCIRSSVFVLSCVRQSWVSTVCIWAGARYMCLSCSSQYMFSFGFWEIEHCECECDCGVRGSCVFGVFSVMCV